MFAYDREGGRSRYRATRNATLFHAGGDRLVSDTLMAALLGPGLFGQNTTLGEGADALCRALPFRYEDLFAVLRGTRSRGMSSAGGEPCELWALDRDPHGVRQHVSACVGSDGVPRSFKFSVGPFKHTSVEYRFTNVVVGPLDEAEFAPSYACAHNYPARPCETQGVAKLELYAAYSQEGNLSRANDALSTAADFCLRAASHSGLSSSGLLSKWQVEANASWGQYAYCGPSEGGGGGCFGHSGKHVGRQGALGPGGGMGGQCSANSDIGSVFSFPTEGRCPEGAQLGSGGCTWKAYVARTVSYKCLFEDRELKYACGRERGHAPMARSAAIIQAALASADPARGGCPDAPQHGLQQAPPVLVV